MNPAPGGRPGVGQPDYPLFLDLRDRPVLVVGAGTVGTRRALALHSHGADVTVVSPTAHLDLVAAAGERLRWLARPYHPRDLEGTWLVHACTGDDAVDSAVVAAAGARQTWVVRASDGDRSPAWSAVGARAADGVQFAVSGGRDPARALALRDLIEELAGTGALPTRRSPHRRRGRPGRVHLVGAGPGDPELITVRGRKLLNLADVVLVDRLAPADLTARATPDGPEVIDVGKTPGRHPLPQEEINALLIQHARAGRNVVRLKGGDPFVLGRGGEEALACLRAGVDVEVVPGVTSAVSVPAAAGIPVTHRGSSQAFLVMSAHDGADSVRARAGATPPDTTLVLLMGVRHLGDVARALVGAGRPDSLPVAVISSGWTPAQRTLTATLGTIAAVIEAEPISSPAVVVVGEVAALGTQLGQLGLASPDSGHLPRPG